MNEGPSPTFCSTASWTPWATWGQHLGLTWRPPLRLAGHYSLFFPSLPLDRGVSDCWLLTESPQTAFLEGRKYPPGGPGLNWIEIKFKANLKTVRGKSRICMALSEFGVQHRQMHIPGGEGSIFWKPPCPAPWAWTSLEVTAASD
jgi:hypothetical protein